MLVMTKKLSDSIDYQIAGPILNVLSVFTQVIDVLGRHSMLQINGCGC